MRVLILKDISIKSSDLNIVTSDFSSLIDSHTGITPTYFIEEEDYSNIPTESDSDGDLKPTKAYLKALTDKVYSKYGTYGIDSIVVLVHRNNWIFTGIWGTNWSNIYRQYHVHLCRFDNKNLANSLGTLYHEWMHSLDALISTHTGFEVDTLFDGKCFADWDTTVVHGNRFFGCPDERFAYIRYKENTKALKLIAPHLKEAYKNRKELYLEPYRQVQLKVITWLRSLLNRKDGVPRI